ncbi:MAG: ATP-binding protein [Candidatus Methylomirabilales bacterium]
MEWGKMKEFGLSRQLLQGIPWSWRTPLHPIIRFWQNFWQSWKPRRFPIAYKLALAITILISGSMAFLAVVNINTQTQFFRSQIDALGQTLVNQMSESAKEMILANDTLGLKVLTTNLASDERVLGTAIYDHKGKLLAQSGMTPALSASFDPSILTLDWTWHEPSGSRISLVSFISPVRFKDIEVARVLITFSRSSMYQSLQDSVRNIGIATLSMIVLVIGMSFAMSKRFSRPIHRLVEASRAVGEGDFEHRIHERRADEIGDVMAAFDSMAEGLLEKQRIRERKQELEALNAQLEAVSTAKSQFLANVSHEVRTPINAIIGYSEMLEDPSYSSLTEKQMSYVQNISASARHLRELINDILDLSKVEAGKIELHFDPFLVREALGATLATIRPQADAKGLKLVLDETGCPDTMVADLLRFRQILYNLLSNAVKFTPEGGQVTVTAQRNGESLTVAVQDTGIGFKSEDMPRLFEEFTQLDASLSRREEGTGLGLALTKKLVELHGGTIQANSSGEGQGSTFTFTLPLNGSAPAGQREALTKGIETP